MTTVHLNSKINKVYDSYHNSTMRSIWLVDINESVGQSISLFELNIIHEHCVWETVKDISNVSIIELVENTKLTKKKIGIFLTAIYRYFESAQTREYIITQALMVKGVLVYEKLYRYRQEQQRDRRKYERNKDKERKNPNIQPQVFKSQIAKKHNEHENKISLLEQIICNCLVNGELQSDELILELAENYPLTWLFSNNADINSKPLLPSWIATNWQSNIKNWVSCEELFFEFKKYESEKGCRQSIGYLNLYVFIFLPIWFHFNQKCQIGFPSKVNQFNGSFFVSRTLENGLDYDEEIETPTTLMDFIHIAYACRFSANESYYSRINNIKNFFEIVSSRYTKFGFKRPFQNPILKEDLPTVSKRSKSTKERIPSFIFPAMLQIAKKHCELAIEINKKLREGKITDQEYNRLFKSNDDSFITSSSTVIRKLSLNIDFTIEYQGKKIKIPFIAKSLFKLRSKIPFKTGSFCSQIMFHPLTQIAVALETGLRHQSIQWLSRDFDKDIDDKIINEQELYPLFVKTDKAKTESWTATVSGSVINSLRKLKEFNNLLGYSSFDNELYYEGRDGIGKNSLTKWGKYLLLMSYNSSTGMPYSDSHYDKFFKWTVFITEKTLTESGFKCNICKTVEKTYKIKERGVTKYRLDRVIETKLTPHTTRLTVISEMLNFLPADYIGQHITGQSVTTVCYYQKLENEDINKLKSKQIESIRKMCGSQSGAYQHTQIATIDTTSPNSTLATSFKNTPKESIQDFGAISPNFMPSKDSGISIISNSIDVLDIGLGDFNICPFGFKCPREIIEKGLEKRCELCYFSVQTVDHLPSIAAEKRKKYEELDEYNQDLNYENNSSEFNERIEANRARISETIAAHELSEKVLTLILDKMGDKGSHIFIANKPDIIKQKLQKRNFPAYSDKSAYFLERIEECVAYPSSKSPQLKSEMLLLRMRLLANTNNIKKALNPPLKFESLKAETYSIIKQLKSFYNLTTEQIAKIADSDIGEFYQSGPSLITIDVEKLLGDLTNVQS